MFSLIRQESAFNPRARSSSDAFGLMQLIPSTARAMARKIKRPYRGVRDLYHPGKNIHLGTYYLKHLLKKYDNSFILAVASYNAGETQTRKWRKTLNKSNPLEFIENITYEETRTYVRLLIRNFIF
ncbi:MAG: lytic transglycosylase domain-containing protein, partial [Bdellovibrionales bacterium]|nr:lytic transglycosylase domain-containing protein [Bdellovibrionales bacterium]